ncbi:unnamed protein product [Phytomonas sp. EM1]|nr:unnamed protein product [Phytomonas sp. EM1]|eukprot:CCW63076.1 unnamed protein product [Phytomonas sp. isolate EM1]
MESRLVQATCHTADFPAVEAELRKWEEVEAVGSFRKKQNNKKDLTTVFITFSPGHSTEEASSRLATLKELIVEEPKIKQPGGGNASNRRHKNLASELLNYVSQEEKAPIKESSHQKDRTPYQNKRNSRQPPKGESNAAPNNLRQGRGRGFGRGQRNEHYANGQSRGNRQQFQRLPPLEANVAFVDNIPFGTTNDQLMDIFSPYGRILDINRLDLMAMICYDNPDSVQECIQHVNGSKIHNNIVSVSSGTALIPGNIAMHLGL